MSIQSNQWWRRVQKKYRTCHLIVFVFSIHRSGGSLHSPAAKHTDHGKLFTGTGCQSALHQAACSQILLCCCAAALRLAGSCQDLQYSKCLLSLSALLFTSLWFLTLGVYLQCFSTSLPTCLKKAMADKFKEFSEYQLAKYNTRKQRCKHNRKKAESKVWKHEYHLVVYYCGLLFLPIHWFYEKLLAQAKLKRRQSLKM